MRLREQITDMATYVISTCSHLILLSSVEMATDVIAGSEKRITIIHRSLCFHKINNQLNARQDVRIYTIEDITIKGSDALINDIYLIDTT